MKVTPRSVGFAPEIVSEWKKIALVGAAGMLLGFATAAAFNGALTRLVEHEVQRSSGPGSFTVVSQVPETVRTPARPLDAEELAKLRVRNRRLQALVDVLRRRAREHNRQQSVENGE